ARQRQDADPAAARQPVFRITNDYQLVVAERDDGEVGPPERQRHDAEIDRVVQAGFVDFVGAAIFDVNLDLRIGFNELFDVRRQFVKADAVHGGDPYRAGDQRRFDAHPLFQRAVPLQNLFAAGVEGFSRFGRRDAPALAAFDQLPAEPPLQELDLLADG